MNSAACRAASLPAQLPRACWSLIASRRRSGKRLPMTAAISSICLSSAGSRSMRAESSACTVAGISSRASVPASRYGPRGRLRARPLDQAPDALLEEERIASRPLDQQPLERAEPGSRPRRRSSSAVACSGPSGVMRRGRNHGFRPHSCSYSRAEGDEQDEARRGHTIDERVQHRLRLAVGPVQILAHQQQGPLVARPRNNRFTASMVSALRSRDSRRAQLASCTGTSSRREHGTAHRGPLHRARAGGRRPCRGSATASSSGSTAK